LRLPDSDHVGAGAAALKHLNDDGIGSPDNNSKYRQSYQQLYKGKPFVIPMHHFHQPVL